MSKAFTTENTDTDDDDLDDVEDVIPPSTKNYMTPAGFKVLQDELNHLLRVERPKMTEIVGWAAGNGDRSENGDYIYGKKRLREIDRRLRYLTKRLETAEVVDPKKQQNLDRVFFGATVTYVKEDDTEASVKIVGVDEANPSEGKISWLSPVARALMKLRAGDSVEVKAAGGNETIEVLEIKYPL
ncbi:MAG TPA: transcription elongation factor GreB [Patescibacteria group bacterium]|nr:transcription elongation factor GreB [Patescibacteria group bacterium]